MLNIAQKIAQELAVNESQVVAAIALLDEGATVPFIARYRKEVTGGLDDTHLRNLQERLVYLRELDERRAVVLASISEQGKLTNELKNEILAADTKTRLEDLYRPYMIKRRTKAQIAREAGLEPLAKDLLGDPTLAPEQVAAAYVDAKKGVADVQAALDGARQILMEDFSDNAELSGQLREYFWAQAKVQSKVVPGKEQEGVKFKDYFDAVELISKIPSHRALALYRGRTEGILQLALVLDEAGEVNRPMAESESGEGRVVRQFGIASQGRAADAWLRETARWAWRIKIASRLDTELKMRLREAAEIEAIHVFARNLHDLLMASPAGPRATMGLDPGFRTGVKVAVVDATGKLVDTATIYPHEPQKRWDEALAVLAVLAGRHNVELISVGNGTASRETDKLAAELIKLHPQLRLTKVMVSEAGASVYSASEFAAAEFPNLDVSIRGAVSIARRLQDPLAELVKIEPKAIGVGQYQHDLNQSALARGLDAVVEDCVNGVGVDANTASIPLLAKVSGLSATLARNIVTYRDEHGAFKNRKALLEVPRMGAKAFEQSAGFLRIMNGDNPLDASAVHPEAYPVVQRILAKTGKEVRALLADSAFVRKLKPAEFTDERFGEPTVKDIIAELEKPGRDPRPEFKTAQFQDGVESIGQIKVGMILEGVVTNVANFGAFVDIGVHQDGLVHISALADKFVKDPRDVVKAGDVVKVKVLEVDVPRKRISLTCRLTDDPRQAIASGSAPAGKPVKVAAPEKRKEPEAVNAFALAFSQAKKS